MSLSRRPGPVSRLLLRAPAWLYAARLGPLFRGRIVVVGHRGRRSGRRYRTALEVVGRRGEELYVVSAWGRRADWLRNLEASGAGELWDGTRRGGTEFRILDAVEGYEVLTAYEEAHRRAARFLLPRLDPTYDGTEEGRRRLAAAATIVAFRRPV